MKNYRFIGEAYAALAKSLAEIRRMHKAGIVSKEIACGMATSLFDQMAAPAQETRASDVDDGLTDRIREFFAECIEASDASNIVAADVLYRAWCEWSGEDNVSPRLFMTHIRLHYPAFALELRPNTEKKLTMHFIGMRFSSYGKKITEENK